MVRTRFAPSPTGYLHLGSIRTALFAWAYARHHGGTFILRIEDTDLERSTESSVQAILDGMAWIGLDYDEGPYFQMQRMGRYRDVLGQLLEQGKAYRCYCTPEELEALRDQQRAAGLKPRYDGRWRPENAAGRGPPPDVDPVIRFRNPDAGVVAWDDQGKGRIEFDNAELDDLVIARPDGTPTYNFCVVVDDIDMRITHVIRGDDHVNNTPRQINIHRALGNEPPVFAHLPTVLGPDGERLSKRHGAVSVQQYAEEGYLPEAMVNFLARLGWSHGDEEIFTRAQLVEWFDLGAISPSASRFNPEKLAWLNHEHIKRTDARRLGELLVPFLDRIGVSVAGGPDPARVADLLRDRAGTLLEMARAAEYFYRPVRAPEELEAAHLGAEARATLKALDARFQPLAWEAATIGAAIKATAQERGVKLPQVMMPLRVAVCGTASTPSLDKVLEVLGRGQTLARLERYVT